ncbi:Uncharacterized protein SCF082_LOCUS47818 [Durusdinium trenchii]|uniref:Uncharacterized protein n=1 Tax=Durusdinium trenchii TaxID=1381693 RepID=A0ABP0RSW3_9DINO
MPDFGIRRDHPYAANFFFTHVEVLNLQEKLDPESARHQVYVWLREVLGGSELDADSYAPLNFMLKSMELDQEGKMPRLVDVYNPAWTTQESLCTAVMRFGPDFALGQHGDSTRASSIGALLLPASKAKIERMLLTSREEVRVKLQQANPEDVPHLSILRHNLELVKEYLMSLPKVAAAIDEIANLFLCRFQDLQLDAFNLISKIHGDEDFGEMDAKQLWSTIGFLEGIASLGPGNDAMPKCEVGHFQNRLESSLKMCLDNVKRACDGADIESLPRTHQFIRWQSKIRAWSSIKPDLSQQMDSFLQGYIDQAIGGASKHPDELHAHVLLVARLENISDIATQMPGFGDAAKIDGALKDAEECLEKHFEHIFESASQAANASVRAVLESPESDSVDFVVLKTVGKELKESRSAWESGLEAASKTHARVVKWYERLQGAATGWLDSLQECNKEMLDTVGVIAAGGNKSDVDLATGACCKNLYYTMSELVDSLPDVDRQNCMKSTCDVVLLDTLNCFNGVSSAALTLSTQVVNGSATQSILQSLRVLIEVLQGFAWMDIAKDADAPNSTLDKLQKQVQEYSDELYRSLCTLLRTFLETSPVKRSLSKFLRAWKEFQGLSELIPVFQFLEDEQVSTKLEIRQVSETWISGFRASVASEPSLHDLDSFPAEDVNNILHAHDQLRPLLTGILPAGWNQAVERVQKSADDIKMLVFSCVDAPGNYKEKDFVLCTLEKWRGLMLLSLLKMFGPEEQVHEQVKREVLDDLGKVRDMIGNPTERQSAADTLVKLALLELKSSAFNEAQRLWQQYQCLLTTRNFEDDQTIQLQLEDFDFTGLKDLLGERPEKESAESTLSKTFHLRLGRIESTVRERLSLAKRSVHEPEIFAREFRKLKAADAELGDYLKLYKDIQGSEALSKELSHAMAELEEKNYDACLNHADELQCLVSKWEGVDILTRTQLSEAEVALKKAGFTPRSI